MLENRSSAKAAILVIIAGLTGCHSSGPNLVGVWKGRRTPENASQIPPHMRGSLLDVEVEIKAYGECEVRALGFNKPGSLEGQDPRYVIRFREPFASSPPITLDWDAKNQQLRYKDELGDAELMRQPTAKGR